MRDEGRYCHVCAWFVCLHVYMYICARASCILCVFFYKNMLCEHMDVFLRNAKPNDVSTVINPERIKRQPRGHVESISHYRLSGKVKGQRVRVSNA